MGVISYGLVFYFNGLVIYMNSVNIFIRKELIGC